MRQRSACLPKGFRSKQANWSSPLLILRMVETEANWVVGMILLSRARFASIEVEMTACIEIAVLSAKAVRETARVIQLVEAMIRQVLSNQRKLKNPKAAKIVMVPSTIVANASFPSLCWSACIFVLRSLVPMFRGLLSRIIRTPVCE